MVTFILFIISVTILCFLIGLKIRAIRIGKIVPAEVGEQSEQILFNFDLKAWRTDIEYNVKIYGHRIVLYILKQWIRFSFWFKEQKEKRIPKKESDSSEPKQSPFSQFVASFSEYKNHLKNIARKVKEREERKRE